VLDIVAASGASSQQVTVSSVAGGSVTLLQSSAGAATDSTARAAAVAAQATADAALPKAGGTVTGALVIPDATLATHPVALGQITTAASGTPASGTTVLGLISGAIKKFSARLLWDTWLGGVTGEVGQSLLAYILGSKVSVQSFGVTGSGSDELTKIQAAIDYVYTRGGGTVYFPAVALGYRVSDTITKPEGVWLEGEGAEFENGGAVFRGSVIILLTTNTVGSTEGIVECVYRGTYGVSYSDQRDLGGIKNMMVWGNKDNVSNGNCVVVRGLRFCTLDNVYLLYAAEKGLLTSTATVGVAELALNNVYALYNAGTGFDLTLTDSSQMMIMAGSNGRVATGTGNGPGDGVMLRSGNRVQGRFHAWDNGREGVSITAGSDNQLDILAQDNDRFGVLVSAGVSFSNDIRCTVTGNGKSTVNTYADSSRVGIQVSGHGACKLNVTASASTTGTSVTSSQKYAIRNLSDQCSVMSLDRRAPVPSPSLRACILVAARREPARRPEDYATRPACAENRAGC
jgi:hypothetical protein